MSKFYSVSVRITSADLPATILRIYNAGVELRDLVVIDELNIEAMVPGRELKRVKQMVVSMGGDICVIHRDGLLLLLRRIFARPFMLIGLLIIGIFSVYLPNRVLFVEVEGAVILPDKLIIERAAKSGISMGAVRSDVRSEKIKNSLLESLPQLQWVGVNTRGCVAVISVKEKSVQEEQNTEGYVSSIFAAKDGLVMECTVTKGTVLCKPGQIVKSGDKLVSGYTDCGLAIRAERAEGEIYALTNREISVYTPTEYLKRGRLLSVDTMEYLQIGKNIINFDNNSRISDASCVKIYDKKVLTIPGGFSLPVYKITVTTYRYEMVPIQIENDDAAPWLAEYAAAYSVGQMVAGQIIGSSQEFVEDNGVLIFKAQYACYEMIGRELKEEIIN